MRASVGSSLCSRLGLLVALLVVGAGCSKKSAKPAVAVEIDREGGVLHLSTPGGPLAAEVPPGAVDSALTVTATIRTDSLIGAVSPVIELGPHGATFNKPVTVRFPSNFPGFRRIPLNHLRVATQVDGRWELLPTTITAEGIEGRTTHFSPFALVGECLALGTATDFPLIGCPGLSPRIRTSVPVELSASAGQVTLTLSMQAVPGGGVVDITVENLLANNIYYLNHDNDAALAVLQTDAAGELTFQRNLGSAHLTILSPVHGSLTLTAATCVAPVGVWTASTSSCALTADRPDADVTAAVDGMTLDCLDPTTGHVHVLGSSSLRQGFGVKTFGRTGVAIRNCDIRNVDTGLLLSSSSGVTVDSVSVVSSIPASGVHLTANTQAVLSHMAIQNVHTGVDVDPGSQVSVTSSSISDCVTGVASFQALGIPARDVQIERVSSLGVLLELSQGVELRRVTITNPPGQTGETGIALAVGAQAVIADCAVSGMNTGILVQYDAVGADISGSTVTGNYRGLVLDGTGPWRVFHNNLYGNMLGQVTKYGSGGVELSDTQAGSATYQQGNYWGRACPGPIFVAGTDSNRSDVVDSFPYSTQDAWDAGGAPGCVAQILPPTLVSPVEGEFVATATPTFTGTAVPGTAISIAEALVVHGGGVTTDAGTFSVSSSTAFSEGVHTVIASANFAGTSSTPSAPLSFTVDTIPPAAPEILAPPTGTATVDGHLGFAGSTEPLAAVSVFEGGVELGTTTSDSLGSFIVNVNLGAGSHAVTAQATDPAGNPSPLSTVVTIVVGVISATSPMVGNNGKVTINQLDHQLNPFDPNSGQTNALQISGTWPHSTGAQSSVQLQTVLVRDIISAKTGAQVQTISSTVQVPPQTGPGSTSFQTLAEWNGSTAAGTLAATGVYLSKATLTIQHLLPTGGIKVLDTITNLTTVEVLAPPQPPPPLPGGPGSHCTFGEVCNGIDDNCNGLIDEGGVCRSVALLCACSPTTCAAQFVSCGTAPDGCGGLLTCGPPCL